MKIELKKLLKTTLPLALGVFLIWFSLSKLTQSELLEIKQSFYKANYSWIAVSVFLGLLSHLSRAYRWKFMLNPLGYQPKFYNSAFAVFIAYLVNMGIPRAGEISRATTINQYENIPFEKAFGTIVAERIADMIVYLFLIALTFLVQFDLISELLLSKIPTNPLNLSLLLITLSVLGCFIFRLIKKSNHAFVKKIHHFMMGIYDGVKTIFTMEKKWWYIAHTLFIWLAYVMMLYTVSLALPETSYLSIGAILTCFILGTFAFATTNGGIGSYPLALQAALLLYNIEPAIGASFGWIMWTAQTILVIVLGGLAFVLLPFFNKGK